MKVDGRWTSLDRAVDQVGQVIDVLAADRRGRAAARRCFPRALSPAPPPVQVSTDRAAVSPQVLDELLPAARHVPQRYAHTPTETDHGRLPAAQIGLLPGCGHVPMRDNPQLVAHVLLVESA